MEWTVRSVIAVYLLGANLVGFILMGADKKKARKKTWRIPEATLFWAALLGGTVGGILGMQVFRHKTRHRSFVYGMPLILILQILLALFLIFGPIPVVSL